MPWGAEQTTQKFVWGGTVSDGDGCYPSPTADAHGAIDVQVACDQANVAGGGAIFCQQYTSIFFAGVDYGPAAACLNTSATNTMTIASSWFKHDPWTSYHYKLTPGNATPNTTGGELTSAPYPGGNISLALSST